MEDEYSSKGDRLVVIRLVDIEEVVGYKARQDEIKSSCNAFSPDGIID